MNLVLYTLAEQPVRVIDAVLAGLVLVVALLLDLLFSGLLRRRGVALVGYGWLRLFLGCVTLGVIAGLLGVDVRHALELRLFVIGDAPFTPTTVILLVAVGIITRAVALACDRWVLHRLGQEGTQGGGQALMRLAHYVIVGLGLFVGLEIAGFDLNTLAAAGAAFAVGLSLAMQDVAQNFVSGVLLTFEHSVEPGDVLEIEGKMARVVSTGVRSTVVRTVDGEDLVVPNNFFAQNTFHNYTLKDAHYRVRVGVGVAYASDMAQVRRVLTEATQRVTWARQDPAPMVFLNAFGASSVDWEVAVWCDDPWLKPLYISELHEAVWFALQEAQISIAFPQVDVHLDPVVVSTLHQLVHASNRGQNPPGSDSP